MMPAVLVAVMAAVSVLLRALPFILFQKNVPEYLIYLGKVLPAAIVGMLVIYCLKDVSIAASPHGIPELIAAATVISLQVWSRNSLLSILSGTVIYMVLIQTVF